MKTKTFSAGGRSVTFTEVSPSRYSDAWLHSDAWQQPPQFQGQIVQHFFLENGAHADEAQPWTSRWLKVIDSSSQGSAKVYENAVYPK